MEPADTAKPSVDESDHVAKELIAGSVTGDAHGVLTCLVKGVPVDCKDEDGRTALLHACRNDHFTVVRILRGFEPDFNHTDDKGKTALHLACKYSKRKGLMSYLVRHGAMMSTTTESSHRADALFVLSQTDDKLRTILHSAARTCNLPGMEFSISQGIDANSRDENADTPLGYAVMYCNNREPLDYLLSVGAEIDTRNVDGDTLLMLAVLKSNTVGVQFALEIGFNVGDRNFERDNSLNIAHHFRASQDIFDMLREAYRKELPRCRLCGEEPAHVYFKPCRHQISCNGCSEKWNKCLCAAEIVAKMDVISGPNGDEVLVPWDYDVEVKKLADDLAEKTARLAEKTDNLKEVAKDLAEKNSLLAEKDALVADKDALLADKDARLEDKDALLADKDARLADQDALLADKDALLAEKTTKLEEAQDEQTCGICLDRKKEVVFTGCGHTSCWQCCRNLVHCHTCRQVIPNKRRFY